MRRVLLACLFVSLVGVPAIGGDADSSAAELLKAARSAMEIQLRLGDLARDKGDTEGATKAYRAALEIYERAVERAERWEKDRAPQAAPLPGRVTARPAPAADEPFTGPSTPSAVPARAAPGVATPPVKSDQVHRGLAWLARSQSDDGKWDADRHQGGAMYDVGVTGLSLLAFLGAGYTDRGSNEQNPHARTVRLGLRFLIQSQDTAGCFGKRASHSFMYNHCLATLALTEAYAQTRNPRYKKPAVDGVNFILMARNPYLAWRYVPRGGENDTSVTAWAINALASAKHAGFDVDPDAWKGARQWVDKMTDPNFGQVGYNYPGGVAARPEGRQDKFPPEKTASMTAAGIWIRMLCGEDPAKSKPIRLGTNICQERPPVWNRDAGTIDMYYWFYGTLAMYQVGGNAWRRWHTALFTAVSKSQRTGTPNVDGSWDPAGVWGPEGGRVYSTALMTLCLQISHRYVKVFGVTRKPVPERR